MAAGKDVASSAAATIGMFLEQGSPAAYFYILLRACDRFHKEHGRYPGTGADAPSSDSAALAKCCEAEAAAMGLAPSARVPQDYIGEMCRYGAASLHSVAAFMGGVASQEVVKLITHQYIPMCHTLVFNGIAGDSTTFAF